MEERKRHTDPDTPSKPPPKSRKSLFGGISSPAQKEARRLLARSKISRTPLSTPKRGKRARKWSSVERAALVQFVALHQDTQPTDSVWPAMSDTNVYWQNAARFVAETTGKTPRKAAGIRTMVTKEFTKYATLEEAEEAFGVGIEQYSEHLVNPCLDTNKPADTLSADSILKCLNLLTPSQLCDIVEGACELLTVDSNLKLIHGYLGQLSSDNLSLFTQKLFTNTPRSCAVEILDSSFSQVGRMLGLKLYFKDFVSLSFEAMRVLQSAAKPNTLYKFASALGKKRTDGKPCMPIDRMPWGLIQYQVEFFSSSHINQITIPEELYQWTETLASQGLGSGPVLKILTGPMWSGMDRKDVGRTDLDEEVQVNGVVLLNNMKGVGWKQAKALERKYFKLTTSLLQEAFPLRFKGMNVVHEPSVFQHIFALMKPFLKEKSRSRLRFYGSDVETLQEDFGLDVLPEELGGRLGPGDVLAQEWKQTLLSKEEYFAGLRAYRMEMNHHISASKSSDNAECLVGTYRKLNVD